MGRTLGSFNHSVGVEVEGLLEAADALRHLGNTNIIVSENLRDGAVHGAEHIRHGMVDGSANIRHASANIRDAAILSSTKLADTARYIADSNGRLASAACGDIVRGLRDSSAQLTTALHLGTDVAQQISAQFGNDHLRACERLSTGMLTIGSQLENSTIVAIGQARCSLGDLAVALHEFGFGLQTMGTEHRVSSEHLKVAILEGSRCLHIASKEIKTGLIGFGERAAIVLSLAAVLVVVYIFPVPNHFVSIVDAALGSVSVAVSNCIRSMASLSCIGMLYCTYWLFCEVNALKAENIRLSHNLEHNAAAPQSTTDTADIQAELVSMRQQLVTFNEQMDEFRELTRREFESRVTRNQVNAFINERFKNA